LGDLQVSLQIDEDDDKGRQFTSCLLWVLAQL